MVGFPTPRVVWTSAARSIGFRTRRRPPIAARFRLKLTAATEQGSGKESQHRRFRWTAGPRIRRRSTRRSWGSSLKSLIRDTRSKGGGNESRCHRRSNCEEAADQLGPCRPPLAKTYRPGQHGGLTCYVPRLMGPLSTASSTFSGRQRPSHPSLPKG